jgi:hypothetical protein
MHFKSWKKTSMFNQQNRNYKKYKKFYTQQELSNIVNVHFIVCTK